MSEATPVEPPLPPERRLDPAGLARLFNGGRTIARWTDRPVDEPTLRELYALTSQGPTSANCSPARFLFIRTEAGRERLRPALSAGNLEKTMSAPLTVVVAHDPRFFDRLPLLYPHADARAWFAGNDALAHETAFRNGTLQGAYLILAARALGLDAGPMSGFDQNVVDETLLAEAGWHSNFLVNLGYGDRVGLRPRDPRLAFADACRFA